MASEIETNMVGVERIKEYQEVIFKTHNPAGRGSQL